MTFEEWLETNSIASMHRDICRSSYQAGQAESRELVERMREALQFYAQHDPYHDHAEKAIAEADKFLGKGEV